MMDDHTPSSAQPAARRAMGHDVAAAAFPSPRENRAAMLWGIAVGLLRAATPLVIWWLDRATVYALGLVVIAGIYVGFAVADGRARVIAAESGVAFAFVVVAAAAVTGSPWLLVAGLAGHGLKDLWQHRTHFVSGTRWVAAVLHGRRLGRGRDHRRGDRRRHALRVTLRIAGPAGARMTVVAKSLAGDR
jgi:hypothetical protein